MSYEPLSLSDLLAPIGRDDADMGMGSACVPSIASSTSSITTASLSVTASDSSSSLSLPTQRELARASSSSSVVREDLNFEGALSSILADLKDSLTESDAARHALEWERKCEALRAQSPLTKDEQKALTELLKKNETTKEWYRTDAAAQVVRKLAQLAPYQTPIPYAGSSSGSAFDSAWAAAGDSLDVYTPEDLERMSWEAGKYGDSVFPPCALGKECIGCQQVLAPYLPNHRPVVFMARLSRAQLASVQRGETLTDVKNMCVLDEWRAFEEYYLALAPTAGRAEVQKSFFFKFYTVTTEATRHGFHASRLWHPSSAWKGLCAPFPKFDLDAIRFVADASVGGRVRCDFSRMNIDPFSLEVQLLYPESSSVASSFSASSSMSSSSASGSSAVEEVSRSTTAAIKNF